MLPRMDSTCSVDGCAMEEVVRGFCLPHYQAGRDAGIIDLLPPRPKRKRARCTRCGREDCLRRTLCSTCYQSDRRLVRGLICSIPGCGHVLIADGLCAMHYGRRRRTGDPLKVTRAPRGSGCISRGYRVIQKNGRLAGEHRWLAEEILGRVLLRDENVHHRNGVKTDNSIGPCLTATRCECPDGPHNLELWSRCQPAGKRVADLISYAKEILKRYG